MRRWRGAFRHVVAFGLLGGCSDLQAHELEPPHEIRPGCLSATDGCRVCRIGESGDFVGCSFPGIARLPVTWQCNEPRSVLAPKADAPSVDAVAPLDK